MMKRIPLTERGHDLDYITASQPTLAKLGLALIDLINEQGIKQPASAQLAMRECVTAIAVVLDGFGEG